MNILIEKINALEFTPLSQGNIIRKILMILHQPTYNIIMLMTHDKEINKLTITEVVGKIHAHELFLQIDKCKNLTLKVNTKVK
uniref:Uncharacterized protein n=1 Tax=Arundo donax TaxID=35708 RepID=A0A0A9JIS4_ARUDO